MSFRRRSLALGNCLLFIAIASASLPAQTAPTGQTPPTAQPAESSSTAAGAEQPAKEFTLPPDKYREAVEYSRAKYTHYFVNGLYGILVLVPVLVWKLGPKYRDWAEKASSRRFVQLIVYAPLMLLTISVLSAPSDVWDEWLARKYGLSVQSWGSWAGDWVKGLVLSLVIFSVLVWILYGVIRRSPRRWWFYFWLASLPVLLFVLFLSPVVIEPMFFKFTPLQPRHPELVAEMEKVVQRGGMEIPPDRMYEMNASTKLTGLNASVSGFGASKRVEVWDTTLAKVSTPEILIVFGHEMGHYILHHIPKEIAIDAILLLILLYAGFRAANWLLARRGVSWGIRDIGDWASLPALVLVLTVLSFFATPAFNSASRYFEHEADRYALEVTHGLVPNARDAAIQYFQISGAINLADPDPSPFIVFWFFDHPSRPQRIHFMLTYDPWKPGESPRYVK
jgi:STE24 endopeptidase